MTTVEIPNRSLFKAPEVCEIAQLQPYVLRSWEAEFPNLGVAKVANGPRVYRRTDLERVLRIKQLLFVEGLTLAGVRRRLDEEQGSSVDGDEPALEALLGADAHERIVEVRQGLRWILDLLQRDSAAETLAAAPKVVDIRRAQMKKAVVPKGGRRKKR